jgi:hypothetical protein
MGGIVGLVLPFWLGWVTLDFGINISAQSNSFTNGLVGPILIGITSAIVGGLVGMMLGMLVDGYAKKEV